MLRALLSKGRSAAVCSLNSLSSSSARRVPDIKLLGQQLHQVDSATHLDATSGVENRLLTPEVVANDPTWAPLAIPEFGAWRWLRETSAAVLGADRTEAIAKWVWERSNRDEKIPFTPDTYVVGRVNILF